MDTAAVEDVAVVSRERNFHFRFCWRVSFLYPPLFGTHTHCCGLTLLSWPLNPRLDSHCRLSVFQLLSSLHRCHERMVVQRAHCLLVWCTQTQVVGVRGVAYAACEPGKRPISLSLSANTDSDPNQRQTSAQQDGHIRTPSSVGSQPDSSQRRTAVVRRASVLMCVRQHQQRTGPRSGAP